MVQGVGFRPFICRIAARHNLFGEVDNRTDGVSIILQCDNQAADRFSKDVLRNAPPAANIKSIEVNPVEVEGYRSFSITQSRNADDRITEISPDIAVCNDCLDDMQKDPFRIDYPFINCTNCGPRFTIIGDLPYDRPTTTMSPFLMCGHCNSEYNDILNRRFHAQPIACNSCGPVYRYKDPHRETADIRKILEIIKVKISRGKTIAVKGTGGYHLMCDAMNNEAVLALRMKKQRDSKPFAVMFRDIAHVKRFCHLSREEENEISSWRRPVVILKKKESLAECVSMGLNTTGAMLPYMPFHYLIFRKIETPAVVLTSGNFSEEPIITDDKLAEKKLLRVADGIISYDRQILNRTDDSVVRITAKKLHMLRRSRGFVPRPIDLNCSVEGILALGAEEKSCFCIGKGSQSVMSQYIGDLKNQSTFDFFTESIERFSKLFRFRPELIACDLHPDYLSTMYAELLEKKLSIPLVRVQHHHAHIVSCMAEHSLEDDVIGVSFDGTGLGTDGNIWGSEFMITGLKDFRRISHFDYVPLPGGEKAVYQPWRTALAYLYKYCGDDFDYSSLSLFKVAGAKKIGILKEMIRRDVNSPLSSGAGRLFDAVAALLGLCVTRTFDAEGPMRLECAICDTTDDYYPFTTGDSIGFGETFKEIISELREGKSSLIAAKFHNTIAHVILETVLKIRETTSLKTVVLSGGVFQNKYLLEKTLYLLKINKFRVFTNSLVPSNDGGISLGQLVIASKSK